MIFPFNKSKVLNLLLENSKELLIDKYRKRSDQLAVLDRRIRELNIDRKNIFFTFLPNLKDHSIDEIRVHQFLKKNYPNNYFDSYTTLINYKDSSKLIYSDSPKYTSLAHRIIKNRIYSYFRHLEL